MMITARRPRTATPSALLLPATPGTTTASDPVGVALDSVLADADDEACEVLLRTVLTRPRSVTTAEM